MGRALRPSGQLDLVDLLGDHLARVEDNLTSIEDALNPQIDANTEDKLLMEMLDVVSDARESTRELSDLVQTMSRRDRADELPQVPDPL